MLYFTYFEITGGPCNLIGSNWCNLFTNHTIFFALNCIFFPANEEATLKTKQPIRLQGLFKVTNQIAGKWKTKSIMWHILQLLFPKLLFQNGCNKVVIEPHVVQFFVWNHTCDFKLNSHCMLVWFWNNTYDYGPSCTPLSLINILMSHNVKNIKANSNSEHKI